HGNRWFLVYTSNRRSTASHDETGLQIAEQLQTWMMNFKDGRRSWHFVVEAAS
ncbi:hypothetical protein Dimus_003152, partial [Dionaea muscipula]